MQGLQDRCVYLHGKVHLPALVVGHLDGLSSGLDDGVIVGHTSVLLDGVEDHDVTPCALVQAVVEVNVHNNVHVVVRSYAHALLQGKHNTAHGRAGGSCEPEAPRNEWQLLSSYSAAPSVSACSAYYRFPCDRTAGWLTKVC